MTPNIERLQGLLAWAEGEAEKAAQGKPSQWDQTIWSNECGTSCCIAGKVALEEGLTPRVSTFYPRTVRNFVTPDGDFVTPDGDSVDPSDFAQDKLGLTLEQADALFEENNTLSDLRHIIGKIAEDPGWDPEDE